MTERIRLATNMVVLPYHHPLEVVKHYGTLDRLSNGRRRSSAWASGRSPRSSRCSARDLDGPGRLPTTRSAPSAPRGGGTSRATTVRTGPFDDVVVDPSGVQEHLPIWVGGRTMPSLRRAVELGDAWVPFIIGPDEVRAMLDRVRDTPAWTSGAPLDVALWPEPVLDPHVETPTGSSSRRTSHLELGATILNYRFPSRSVAHHLEQMEALTRILDFD